MEKERESDVGNQSRITVKVKFTGGRTIPVEISAESTVEHLKSLLQPLTNVLPSAQKLIFKGKVLVDEMTLKLSEVVNGAKIMLMASQGLHQAAHPDEVLGTSAASETIARVREEVDRLSNKLVVIEEAVKKGTKVEDREFVVLTELFMNQLLTLDSIEADGEARAQRRKEVHRIQGFVDALDNFKARNSNLLSSSTDT